MDNQETNPVTGEQATVERLPVALLTRLQETDPESELAVETITMVGERIAGFLAGSPAKTADIIEHLFGVRSLDGSLFNAFGDIIFTLKRAGKVTRSEDNVWSLAAHQAKDPIVAAIEQARPTKPEAVPSFEWDPHVEISANAGLGNLLGKAGILHTSTVSANGRQRKQGKRGKRAH